MMKQQQKIQHPTQVILVNGSLLQQHNCQDAADLVDFYQNLKNKNEQLRFQLNASSMIPDEIKQDYMKFAARQYTGLSQIQQMPIFSALAYGVDLTLFNRLPRQISFMDLKQLPVQQFTDDFHAKFCKLAVMHYQLCRPWPLQKAQRDQLSAQIKRLQRQFDNVLNQQIQKISIPSFIDHSVATVLFGTIQQDGDRIRSDFITRMAEMADKQMLIFASPIISGFLSYQQLNLKPFVQAYLTEKMSKIEAGDEDLFAMKSISLFAKIKQPGEKTLKTMKNTLKHDFGGWTLAAEVMDSTRSLEDLNYVVSIYEKLIEFSSILFFSGSMNPYLDNLDVGHQQFSFDLRFIIRDKTYSLDVEMEDTTFSSIVALL